jgi:hypothetical protein
VDALRDAVALVPASAPVSASDKAGSHLSARRYFYSVPVLGRAQWIVLDLEDPFVVDPTFPVLVEGRSTVRSFERRIETNPAWTKVFDRAGVLVFRRVAPA